VSGTVRRLLRGLPAALAVVALLLPAAPRASAADIAFGTPEATAKYLDSITFTVPLETSVPLERVELHLSFPGSLGPSVVDVPATGTGRETLTYRLDATGGGHIEPNTPIAASWVAIPTGGGVPVHSASQTVMYEDTTHEWRTLNGRTVTVHWYEGDEGFGREALKVAEDSVASTSALLGVTESKPIDYFIYGDRPSFMDAMGPGAREWMGGRSISETRSLYGLMTPDEIGSPEVNRLIVHELVHLVFHSAVDGQFGNPPAWFDEGLAEYLSADLSPSWAAGLHQDLRTAVKSGELLPLTALDGAFPTSQDRSLLAYAESRSSIDYIVRTYGQPAFLALVAAYRDGLTDDEALKQALGVDLAGFQQGWLADLGGEMPQQYGPRENPPGPVPPGWDQPPAAGGPDATPDVGPGATTSPGSAPTVGGNTGTGEGGGDRLAVLVAIAIVVVVVIVGMVVARRRTPAA